MNVYQGYGYIHSEETRGDYSFRLTGNEGYQVGMTVNFDIRKYIIDRYGSGCFSAFDIRMRQAVILSRCAWQLKMPLHAAYYFFGTVLGHLLEYGS